MVFSSDASADLRLSPLPETEESKKIDKTVCLLEPKNSTATLTNGVKEKAKAEYKKYQVKTISPVEQEYLNTIKEISKEIKKEENNN